MRINQFRAPHSGKCTVYSCRYLSRTNGRIWGWHRRPADECTGYCTGYSCKNLSETHESMCGCLPRAADYCTVRRMISKGKIKSRKHSEDVKSVCGCWCVGVLEWNGNALRKTRIPHLGCGEQYLEKSRLKISAKKFCDFCCLAKICVPKIGFPQISNFQLKVFSFQN